MGSDAGVGTNQPETQVTQNAPIYGMGGVKVAGSYRKWKWENSIWFFQK